MNKVIITLLGVIFLVLAINANARDSKYMYSIQEALDSENFKARLDPKIALFFGKAANGIVTKSYGTFPTNKKTNSFNKSDLEACEWVLLSALISLQERAVKEGGNAVVNIASYYKKNTVVSETEYECHAGAIIAGVALIGDVVTIEN